LCNNFRLIYENVQALAELLKEDYTLPVINWDKIITIDKKYEFTRKYNWTNKERKKSLDIEIGKKASQSETAK
jgi:RNase H-fold protein (predicted Holliday junction resolvase)